MKKELPSIDAPPAPVDYVLASKMFEYEPITGELIRLTGKAKGNPVKSPRVRIDDIKYATKTIAWFLYHGKWPSRGVSPIDGDETNLKIDNLTEANAGAPPPHIELHRLTDLVAYNPETGEFTRKTYGGVGYPIGSVMNRPRERKDKYGQTDGTFLLVRIKLDGRMYCAHHLAVLYMTGRWPRGVVKHVNGQQEDLTWKNLEYR